VDLGYFGDGAQLAADLVNTRGWIDGKERLTSVDDVRAFLEAHGQTRRVTKADLTKLLDVRNRLRDIFAAGDDEIARRRINALIAEFPTHPQLAGDGGVTFEPIANDATSWIGVHAVLGLAFFIAKHGTNRLGICDASDCSDAYVDETKNAHKRYCSGTCARLESVRAFRERKRSAGTEGPTAP
jgi:predicted RNA-binding Zn ribbon-like protein